MTYELYIGDKTFSSWSLRGWLMFRKFDLPMRAHMVGLYAGTMAKDLSGLPPARLVPVMRTPEGTVVGESLAMAETLAERHPDAGLWPKESAQRATARWLCAEMCAGFGALRGACPMQLLRAYRGFEPGVEVRADLERLDVIWSHARRLSGAADGWLFGTYSLADVFYTPMAARIIGYGLPVSANAKAYALALLADPEVQQWRADGLKTNYTPEPHRLDFPSDPWPVA
ncbi:glutathione S-transferase [Aestuariivita sp.]|jgi:glutathione S-transferase|uniref:glutathione S-transferase n=1 Tax=Aestuariivita sp. TaxID=1872407 RepID=UPI002171DCBF|nr:glutathione S-transferase [Aestuariivita sp.]MCE8007577.1 glutathione S-transferase [Aestuariivita sp.]